jgi:hypothetical protein
MPAMNGSEAVFPGIYFAVTAFAGAARAFRGALLLESLDDWDTYTAVSPVRGLVTAGIARWREYGIEVELHRGELSTCSEGQLRSGQNRAMIGGELVGFREAELQDIGTWRLTADLRGMKSTPRSDVPGWQPFILLTDQPIIFHEIDRETLGIPRQYKAACSGQAIDDLEAVVVTPRGINATPFRWLWESGANGDPYAPL